jgi:hypothetical protein
MRRCRRRYCGGAFLCHHPSHLSSPNNPKFPTTTLLLMHIDVTNVVATKSRQKQPKKKKKKIQKI